jgi:hypothetical protein
VRADGTVVGSIVRVHAEPIGSPWMWTLAFGHHEDRTPTHGCEPTREATTWQNSRPGSQAADGPVDLRPYTHQRADRSAAFYRAAASLVQKMYSELIDDRTSLRAMLVAAAAVHRKGLDHEIL